MRQVALRNLQCRYQEWGLVATCGFEWSALWRSKFQSERDDLSCFGRRTRTGVRLWFGVGPSRRRYHWIEGVALGSLSILYYHDRALVTLTKVG
jgi:hypothetical protein